MIVCHCAGVTDDVIVALIREGVSTVKDIARRTGAGRCCAPCRDEIRSLLAEPEPAMQSAAE
jgi:bacterioferritin-associated ferredoxin